MVFRRNGYRYMKIRDTNDLLDIKMKAGMNRSQRGIEMGDIYMYIFFPKERLRTEKRGQEQKTSEKETHYNLCHTILLFIFGYSSIIGIIVKSHGFTY